MILDKYTTFQELILDINSFSDIKICFGGVIEHNGITFVGKGLPISINEHEFNYMHDFIIEHKLICGYELATGTGISALSSAVINIFTGLNEETVSKDAFNCLDIIPVELLIWPIFFVISRSVSIQTTYVCRAGCNLCTSANSVR